MKKERKDRVMKEYLENLKFLSELFRVEEELYAQEKAFNSVGSGM